MAAVVINSENRQLMVEVISDSVWPIELKQLYSHFEKNDLSPESV